MAPSRERENILYHTERERRKIIIFKSAKLGWDMDQFEQFGYALYILLGIMNLSLRPILPFWMATIYFLIDIIYHLPKNQISTGMGPNPHSKLHVHGIYYQHLP